MLKHGIPPITDLRTHGSKVLMLANSDHIVWCRQPDSPGLLSLLGTRIVEEDVGHGLEKWFEVGIPVRSIDDMIGNASAGWTTLHGFFRLVLEWSEDLETWAVGKFTSAGTTSETLDGIACTIYWCRSIYPMDSSIKTGQLVAQNSVEARNNPIIAVTIEGVLQLLTHAPYDMTSGPARAQLQADLRGLGWTGATVTGSDATDWQVVIPGVTLSSYELHSFAAWPMWSGYDFLGHYFESSNVGFSGSFINAAGVRTFLKNQFVRLGITPLKL